MLSEDKQQQEPDKEKQAALLKNSRETFFRQKNFDSTSETYKDSPEELNKNIPDMAATVVTHEAKKLGDEHLPTITSVAVSLAIEIQETFKEMGWVDELAGKDKVKFMMQSIKSTLTMLEQDGNVTAGKALSEMEQMGEGGETPVMGDEEGTPPPMLPPTQPQGGTANGL